VESIIKEPQSDSPLLDEQSNVTALLPGRFRRPAEYFHHPIQEVEDVNE